MKYSVEFSGLNSTTDPFSDQPSDPDSHQASDPVSNQTSDAVSRPSSGQRWVQIRTRYKIRTLNPGEFLFKVQVRSVLNAVKSYMAEATSVFVICIAAMPLIIRFVGKVNNRSLLLTASYVKTAPS